MVFFVWEFFNASLCCQAMDWGDICRGYVKTQRKTVFKRAIPDVSFECDCAVGLVLKKKRQIHDDVIKWQNFPRHWPFVRGIHQSPVNSPHKGQWRGALMFSLTCAWLIGWINNREAGDLRRYRAHYDVIVMLPMHVVYRRNKKLGSSTPLLCANSLWTVCFLTLVLGLFLEA